jgi:hypothetical protein
MAVDKGVFYAIGQGDIRIKVPNGQKTTEVILWATLNAVDMGLMVVSIGCIANASYAVAFEGNLCKIKNKSRDIIGNIPAGPNGLYKVECAYMAGTRAGRHADPAQVTWPHLAQHHLDSHLQ